MGSCHAWRGATELDSRLRSSLCATSESWLSGAMAAGRDCSVGAVPGAGRTLDTARTQTCVCQQPRGANIRCWALNGLVECCELCIPPAMLMKLSRSAQTVYRRDARRNAPDLDCICMWHLAGIC